jgi:hypothetical protein
MLYDEITSEKRIVSNPFPIHNGPFESTKQLRTVDDLAWAALGTEPAPSEVEWNARRRTLHEMCKTNPISNDTP